MRQGILVNKRGEDDKEQILDHRVSFHLRASFGTESDNLVSRVTPNLMLYLLIVDHQ